MGRFNFIGTGAAYPLNVSAGYAPIITGNELIESSIIQILGISVGSLPHNPYFGSHLNRLLFQPNDVVVISAGKAYIVEAIKQWEGRVEVLPSGVKGAVSTSQSGAIEFTVQYRVLAENRVETFVYPFYRKLKF